MSNILRLNEDILKNIYAYLNLKEKFTFTTVNRKLQNIFKDYRLLDTVLVVAHRHYIESNFVFNNVINIKVMHKTINNGYLSYFKNLQEIDVSMMRMINFGQAKSLLDCLTNSVKRIYVNDSDMKELLELAIHINSRSCMV